MALLSKYTWVVSTLLRAGERGLSLKELNERWVQNDMSYGKPIPRPTFDRWKGAILDTIGVVVECHLQWPYRYYISNPRVLAEGALGQWLLDTFNTFNYLSARCLAGAHPRGGDPLKSQFLDRHPRRYARR